MSVQRNIDGIYPKLSKSERRLADYLKQFPQEVVTMNVHDFAQVAQTSPATVSRFARNLSFDNYNQLKLQLAYDLSQDVDADQIIQADIQENESILSIKNKLLHDTQRSLKETVEQIRSKVVLNLVEELSKTQKIMVFGVGASNLVAQDIAQKWARLGIATSYNDDINQFLPLVVNSNNQNSLLWLVSNSGESPEAIAMAQYAKKSHIPVVTMTAFGKNTLTKYADIGLQTSHPIESSIRIAATDSLQTQLFLVNIIYYAYVSQNYTPAKLSVERSRTAIDTYKAAVKYTLKK